MGNDVYSKFNYGQNLPINIELNKVCYFPEEIISGTITLSPRLEVFEPLLDKPELFIILDEYQCYTYVTNNGEKSTTNRAHKKNNLINIKLIFKDYITTDYKPEIKFPFKVQIPKEAYPSLIFSEEDFVRHYLSIEVPHCKVKRTKVIIIRNAFPSKVLTKNFETKKEFSKSKLFSDKGSVTVKVKMPKNFYFYDENIPFEMDIDCSNLNQKLKIKSVKVLLARRKRINYTKERTKERYSGQKEIYTKEINLEKGLTNYTITDIVNFPIEYHFPPKIYEEFEKHGIYEVNDKKLNIKLYPSCRLGVLSCEYFLKFRLHFDSLLTCNEKLKIPLYFTENNELNQSLKNQVFNLSTYYYEDEDDSDNEENGIEKTSSKNVNANPE